MPEETPFKLLVPAAAASNADAFASAADATERDTIELDALWSEATEPVALVVLAHGAGAGFRHTNMQALSDAMVANGLSTLRFNFPYMQAGKKRVDSAARAGVAIAAASAAATSKDAGLPLFLAGHSFGGRMASHAVVDLALPCAGLIYCSFPLHPPRKPGVARAQHLPDIAQPMLFLSGTRDDLATADLLNTTVAGLRRARIHWLETANHAYTVLKRTRQNPLGVFAEIGLEARRFVDEVI